MTSQTQNSLTEEMRERHTDSVITDVSYLQENTAILVEPDFC